MCIYNESSGRRAILKLLIKSPPAAAAAAQRIKTNERDVWIDGKIYYTHTTRVACISIFEEVMDAVSRELLNAARR